MPNYRYNMPEYERRNNCGSYSQSAPHRHNQQNCSGTRETIVTVQSSCEPVRKSCDVPRRECQERGEMSCAVSDNYDALAGMPLAMAYVSWQMWRRIYDAEKALCQGTIFEELDKPFRGMGGVC